MWKQLTPTGEIWLVTDNSDPSASLGMTLLSICRPDQAKRVEGSEITGRRILRFFTCHPRAGGDPVSKAVIPSEVEGADKRIKRYLHVVMVGGIYPQGSKIKMKFYILVLLSLLVTIASAFAADKFEERYVCDPKFDNVKKIKCIMDYYSDLDARRLELEKKVIESARQQDQFINQKTGRQGQNEQRCLKAKKSFENYREDECTAKMVAMGSASMAGHGKVGCLINLTEQRIGQINGQ